MAAFSELVTWYFLNAAWQSTLLFSLTALVTRLWRRGPHRFHRNLWLSALITAPLLPFISVFFQTQGLPIDAVGNKFLPSTQYIAPAIPEQTGTVPPSQYLPNITIKEDYQTPIDPLVSRLAPSWKTGLMVLYILGASGFSIAIFIAYLNIRRWTREAKPITNPRILSAFEVAQVAICPKAPYFLYFSPGIVSPILVGILNHRVFLPETRWEEFSDEELRDLALHEMAHLRFADPLAFSLAAIGRAILFFNPLAWFAHHRLTLHSEIRADETVINITEEVIPYTKMLCRLAEQPVASLTKQGLAPGILSQSSIFLKRAEQILSDDKKVSSFSPASRVGVGLSVLAIYLLAIKLPLSFKSSREQAASSFLILAEEWDLPSNLPVQVTQHLNLTLPIEFHHTSTWNGKTSTASTTYFTGKDAEGKNFEFFLDRDPTRSTYGQWSLGGYFPGDQNLTGFAPNSAQEKTLEAMMIHWVSQRFTRHQWEQLVAHGEWTNASPEELFALSIDECIDSRRRFRK